MCGGEDFMMGRPKRESREDSSDSQVIAAMKQMFESFKCAIHKEVNDLKEAVQFISNKFDTFTKELEETKKELKTTKGQVQNLIHENDALRKEVNELQQYTRRDNLLLFGMPETPEETIESVVEQVSAAIGMSNVTSDISIVHRLPARPGKTKPIVIRFCKRRSRDAWLLKFKEESKKHEDGPGIPLQRIDPQLPAGRITAGEHLTAFNRDLLNSAREAARHHGFKFVWSRDCKVFMRKDENSYALRINNFNDLQNL